MKIFISWSGEQSRFIAKLLSEWIEQVIQVAEPWISTDIEKGKRWNAEIAGKLEESKVGIFIMTPSNLSSEWVHFEAGAISKTQDAYVCTLLYKVHTTDVSSALSQFQATRLEKEEMLTLLKQINNQIGKTGAKSLKEKQIENIFESLWPEFEGKLKSVPESENEPEIRTEKELMEESLNILRYLKNTAENGNGTTVSESDMDEIVDWWIEKYASTNKLDLTSYDLRKKESEIYDFMMKFPEIKKIFTSSSQLKNRIISRTDKLLPF
ncbi:toll/interleukin-1 receptor domain-containing protein [Formosa sp. L2A11]|uniref:toll/interleukin-1 receptor domain-containing protein n=1 Tax=Formosa sp. L2A11 TaxID=2686363 RepID=UPI00131B2F36|nr:TIR domain-containing protein [Formosa sp. L2A11]